MVSAFGVVFGGVFAAVGLGMVLTGVARVRKWWPMRKLDPGGMVVEPGLQEFEGRAYAVDEPVKAPLTGSESLVCSYEVERYDHDDDGSNWDTVTSGTETTPFEIDHSGSTVVVDPENAQHLLTEEFQVDTGRTDELPPRVQEYADDNLDMDAAIELGPIELGENRYRLTEQRLDAGETVYVLGPAERDPAAAPAGSDARLSVAPDDHGWRARLFGDPFVVADTGEGGATRRQLKSAGTMLALGLVFGGIGVAVILLG